MKNTTNVTKLRGQTVYKVRNADGLTFWTLIKPSDVDDNTEKVVKTDKMSGKLFNSLSSTDREFIMLEFKKQRDKDKLFKKALRK